MKALGIVAVLVVLLATEAVAQMGLGTIGALMPHSSAPSACPLRLGSVPIWLGSVPLRVNC